MAARSDLPATPEPRFRKLFAVIVALIFTILFLRLVAPFIEAVLLAAVLSGMVYPLFHWIRTHIQNRPAAAVVTVLIVFFVIILPLLFLLGAFVREAIRLTQAIAPWVEEQLGAQQSGAQFPLWVPFGHYLEPYRGEILTRLNEALAAAGTFFVDGVSRLGQGTLVFALNLFIMLYTMFFFLLAGPRWLAFFDYTPLSQADRDLITEKGVSIARATIKGTFIIGVVQGALAGAAFAAVGLPGPVFWGVVMALASVLPAIGAAIVWIPAVVYLFLTNEVGAGIALLAWCALVVSSVDNVLRPRLVGSDTKMPDVLILLSTLGGIAMFGASGIVLGPLIAGFFITSWHIFGATFRRELETTESSPPLLDEETEGITHEKTDEDENQDHDKAEASGRST